MSEEATDDTTANFERIEEAVNRGLNAEEFTLWARDEVVQDSRDVGSGRDFPEGYDTDANPKPNFMTSTPMEGKISPFQFNSMNSIECISARNTPIGSSKRKTIPSLTVVNEENELQDDQPHIIKEKPLARKTNRSETDGPETISPLMDQLRALIQHLDIEQIALRKRQEEYFRHMQMDVEEARRKLKEERHINEMDLHRREKELREREKRVSKDESDLLKSLKSRLHDELKIKNEKQVEIFKLKDKIGTLEVEMNVLKQAAKRRMLNAEKKAEDRAPLIEIQLKKRIAALENEIMLLKRTPLKNEIKHLKQSACKRNVGHEGGSSLNEHEATTPTNDHETTTSSIAQSPPTKPKESETPVLYENVLPCGCRTLSDKYGTACEWTHVDGKFSVIWSDGGNHVELNSPQQVKVTFATDTRLYVIVPDGPGVYQTLVVFSDNTFKFGKCDQEGQLRSRDIEEFEHVKYKDDSLGWTIKDVVIRRFVNREAKIRIEGASMNFVHHPGEWLKLTHLNGSERKTCYRLPRFDDV